jgi:hypothetical protein
MKPTDSLSLPFSAHRAQTRNPLEDPSFLQQIKLRVCAPWAENGSEVHTDIDFSGKYSEAGRKARLDNSENQNGPTYCIIDTMYCTVIQYANSNNAIAVTQNNDNIQYVSNIIIIWKFIKLLVSLLC